MVKKNYDNMLSRFHLIPACDGRTDGRTDRQKCYINIVRQYAEIAWQPLYTRTVKWDILLLWDAEFIYG